MGSFDDETHPPAGPNGPPRRLRPRRARWYASAAVAAIVLTTCGQPGAVGSFNPDVERNFLDACSAAAGGAPVGSSCSCWWREMSATLSFDEFSRFEAGLRAAIEEERLTGVDELRREFPALTDAVDACSSVSTAPLPR